MLFLSSVPHLTAVAYQGLNFLCKHVLVHIFLGAIVERHSISDTYACHVGTGVYKCGIVIKT